MTDHAFDMAVQRGIQQSDIANIINNPMETIYDRHTERYKSYGKSIDPYTKEGVYVIVIHTAFNRNVNIITVMAVNSKGGLKAHGFSNF